MAFTVSAAGPMSTPRTFSPTGLPAAAASAVLLGRAWRRNTPSPLLDVLDSTLALASPALGVVVNTLQRSDAIPPWAYGVGALLRHLRRRRMEL